MSLWYCKKCGTLMNNSMICRFGCGETSRVTHFGMNKMQLDEEKRLAFEWLKEQGQKQETNIDLTRTTRQFKE